MSEADFEIIRALTDVGLDGHDVAVDIRDLRSLLDSIHVVHRTALQTIARMLTTALIIALIACIAVKFKLFGTPL